MTSTRVILALFLTILLMSSCGVRRVSTLKQPEVVLEAPSWKVVKSDQKSPGCEPPRCELLMIVSHNNYATTEAVTKLCKEPKAYVCTAPEKAAEVLYVERRRR